MIYIMDTLLQYTKHFRIVTIILVSLFLFSADDLLAADPEYKVSSSRDWAVANDHVVMKEKNTVEYLILNNDQLPASFSIQVAGYSNNTNFKNAPVIIGKNKLKFHQPQNTGIDTVKYIVCQEGGECLQALAIFRVVKNEDQPNAARDVLITDLNTSVETDVFQNDYGNNSVSLAVVENPENGSYQLSKKSIKYTPNSGFQGVDSLTYQICDGKCSQNQMVIYVLGTDLPPEVSDISLTINEDENYDFGTSTFKPGYSDPANATLKKIKVVQLPQHGTLYYKNEEAAKSQEVTSVNLDKLKYVPDADYHGDDYWLWNATNGTLYAEKLARVNFEIKPVNDIPVANNDEIITNEDQSAIIDVLNNDTDADGDALSIANINHPQDVGTFSVNDDKIFYEPLINYHGTFELTYGITDGKDNASGKVKVIVTSVNDLPVVSDFQVNLNENSQLVFNVEMFENNFSDQDNPNLHKIRLIQLPKHGELFLFDKLVNSSREVIFNDLDNLKYVPEKGFTGTDNIIWNASDGTDYSVSSANLVLNIIDINFSPVARDDNGIITNEDEPIEIDVLANDTDEDGDQLTISNLPAIASGVLEVTSSNKVLFTPQLNYSGSFSFTYQISDGAGGFSEANVNVIVEEINDAPEIEGLSIDLIQNTSYRFSVQQFLDRYDDIETEEFNNIVITSLPVNGVLKLQEVPVNSGQLISPFALNDLVYEPFKNYLGPDSFEWNASDGELTAKEPANVAIDVQRFAGNIHAFKAISPNGDGKNDEWVIEGIEVFPDNTLRLFDRSGELIITISGYDNLDNVWRGEKDRLGTSNWVEDGTYFYNLDLGNGINQVKGFVIVQK